MFTLECHFLEQSLLKYEGGLSNSGVTQVDEPAQPYQPSNSSGQMISTRSTHISSGNYIERYKGHKPGLSCARLIFYFDL